MPYSKQGIILFNFPHKLRTQPHYSALITFKVGNARECFKMKYFMLLPTVSRSTNHKASDSNCLWRWLLMLRRDGSDGV